MSQERFTSMLQGMISAALTLAENRSHQKLGPEHLLKAFLDDSSGLASNLVRAAGGDPDQVLSILEAELARMPQVTGAGAAEVSPHPALGRILRDAEQRASAAGDDS